MTLVRTAQLPEGLLQSIRAGTCVAFVGAGFSQPAVPGWAELLRSLTKAVPDDTQRSEIEGLLGGSPSALDLEAAAEMIREGLPNPVFHDILRQILDGRQEHHPRVQKRVDLLDEIPFVAVLTTNFDSFLPGEGPEPETYKQLLRQTPSGWAHGQKAHTVKLHGDLGAENNRVVLSREDYRSRLYQDGRYATFLRTVLATRTLLFLGVSFTDAYLNELRSEVLALVGRNHDRPLAYAFLADCTEARASYFLKHEGIEVIGYDSQSPPDHWRFDALLQRLRDETRPYPNLRAALKDKRILWLDPNPDNNDYAREFFQADREQGNRLFHEVTEVEKAIEALRQGQLEDAPYDLAITHYGGSDGGIPTAVRFLRALRELPEGVPVVVFASDWDAAKRRREVHRLGALDYCHQWEDLFFVLQTFFRERAGEETAHP